MSREQFDLFPHGEDKGSEENRIKNGKEPTAEEYDEYAKRKAQEAGGQLGLPLTPRKQLKSRIDGIFKYLEEREKNNNKDKNV